jgi:hypothetical protein
MLVLSPSARPSATKRRGNLPSARLAACLLACLLAQRGRVASTKSGPKRTTDGVRHFLASSHAKVLRKLLDDLQGWAEDGCMARRRRGEPRTQVSPRQEMLPPPTAAVAAAAPLHTGIGTPCSAVLRGRGKAGHGPRPGVIAISRFHVLHCDSHGVGAR